ncbi:unnamed protein product [Ilex paraguariensis]|uniref:THO1-MOS11 C-terminal domain-containing protein n=1 Tax=Ilex paraguariensis TaxID=185542 RepID=A0ABC8T5Q1_9AQUA
MATITNPPKVENPKKTLAQPDPTPTTSAGDLSPKTISNSSASSTGGAQSTLKDGGDDSKVTTVATVEGDKDNNSGAVSAIQKKMQRAERFGMPVQLSEQEKRNSRAERFGTGSPFEGSDAVRKSEEHKRKTRAERFGLVQSVSADEEAKKKARLARFTAVSKTDSAEEDKKKATAEEDKKKATAEEDKKKARAIRFSEPASNSLSQVNGEGNIETKTAIAGKAGGGT